MMAAVEWVKLAIEAGVAIGTGVLAIFTWRLASSTAESVKESRAERKLTEKALEASNRIAEAAEKQVGASLDQVKASQDQAAATRESLELARAQHEEEQRRFAESVTPQVIVNAEGGYNQPVNAKFVQVPFRIRFEGGWPVTNIRVLVRPKGTLAPETLLQVNAAQVGWSELLQVTFPFENAWSYEIVVMLVNTVGEEVVLVQQVEVDPPTGVRAVGGAVIQARRPAQPPT
jgi:hypothetical protein